MSLTKRELILMRDAWLAVSAVDGEWAGPIPEPE